MGESGRPRRGCARRTAGAGPRGAPGRSGLADGVFGYRWRGRQTWWRVAGRVGGAVVKLKGCSRSMPSEETRSASRAGGRRSRSMGGGLSRWADWLETPWSLRRRLQQTRGCRARKARRARGNHAARNVTTAVGWASTRPSAYKQWSQSRCISDRDAPAGHDY